MGGKRGKYAYVERDDGWFVRIRVIKTRSDDDPDKYVPTGFKTRKPPLTYQIIREDDLPEEARKRIKEV